SDSAAGGAAEMAGKVVVPAGGGAAARIAAGGSKSKGYSRTSRPVAQEISRITSTKGSCTPRSLTSRPTGQSRLAIERADLDEALHAASETARRKDGKDHNISEIR